MIIETSRDHPKRPGRKLKDALLIAANVGRREEAINDDIDEEEEEEDDSPVICLKRVFSPALSTSSFFLVYDI